MKANKTCLLLQPNIKQMERERSNFPQMGTKNISERGKKTYDSIQKSMKIYKYIASLSRGQQ